MLNRVQELMQQEGHTLLHLTKAGSQLFGTATAESDTDYLGIYLPNKRKMLLGHGAASHITMNTASDKVKNTSEDIDCTLYSLQHFFHLLERGDLTMVDLLFSHTNHKATLYTTDAFLQLFRPMLVSKKLGNMLSYAESQMNKYYLKGERYTVLHAVHHILSNHSSSLHLADVYYRTNLKELVTKRLGKDCSEYLSVWTDKREGHKPVQYLKVLDKSLPFNKSVDFNLRILDGMMNAYGHRTKAASGGPDYKSMYHAVRVSDEIIELYETGELVFPSDLADYYKKVKSGKVGEEAVGDVLAENHEYIKMYQAGVFESSLAEEVDRDYMDSVISMCYDQ